MKIAEKSPSAPEENQPDDLIQAFYDCGRVLQKLDSKDRWRVMFALRDIFDDDKS